jgi:hypothetical protein
MKDLLLKQYGFNDQEIKVLADAQATKQAIVDGLKWLMDAAGAGNRLLFHYSGHGTQLPIDARTVVDSICPVDFDFTPKHAVTAKDFASIFSAIPLGTQFNWLSDSCYSGDLTRALLPQGAKARYLPPPPDVQQAIAAALRTENVRMFRFESSSPLHGGFISGCGPNETSADAAFRVFGKIRYNGAFTYFFLQEVKGQTVLALTKLAHVIISDLRRGEYTQTPHVKGSETIISQPFLGGAAHANLQRRATWR